MSNNRLRLNGENQDIEVPFSNVDIISTAADETIRMPSGVNNAVMNIGDNDQLILGDNISDYEITAPGGNEVNITSGSNTVTVNVGGSGKIGFKDKRGNISIDPGTGNPVFESVDIPSSTPLDISGMTLEDMPSDITEVTMTHSDLVNENTSETSPFDASDETKLYTFEIDANQQDTFYISGFRSKDTIKFINSPTGSDGDLNVTNTNYANGLAQLTVGDADVYLSDLVCAAIWDASSFQTMLGNDALVIE